MLKKKCSQNARTKPAHLPQSISIDAWKLQPGLPWPGAGQAGMLDPDNGSSRESGGQIPEQWAPAKRLVAPVPRSALLCCLWQRAQPFASHWAGLGRAPGDGGTCVDFACFVVAVGGRGDRTSSLEGNASSCPGDLPALASCREEPPKEQTTIIILITNPRARALYNSIFPQEACNTFTREPFISK